MKLNFDLDYLFAGNDTSKTIFNKYSKNDILFVQEEHIYFMHPCNIERCEFNKDINCIPTHTSIIKNPKTNNIDIVSLNAIDFRFYSNYRVVKHWKNIANIYLADTTNKDIDMSKRINSFLEYGDFL